MVVDPMTCMSSNEAERANLDIYDDFKLKKKIDIHGLLINISDL